MENPQILLRLSVQSNVEMDLENQLLKDVMMEMLPMEMDVIQHVYLKQTVSELEELLHQLMSAQCELEELLRIRQKLYVNSTEEMDSLWLVKFEMMEIL